MFVRLGGGGRRVRVPLAPGSFTTIDVAEVRPLAEGESITLTGRTILAFDGERDLAVSPDGTVTVRVESSGPLVIDVERTLVRAASTLSFDITSQGKTQKDHNGH